MAMDEGDISPGGDRRSERITALAARALALQGESSVGEAMRSPTIDDPLPRRISTLLKRDRRFKRISGPCCRAGCL